MIHIVIGGEDHTVKEWSEISGVSEDRIRRRIKRGLNGEDIIAPTPQMIDRRKMISEVWKNGNFKWIGKGDLR